MTTYVDDVLLWSCDENKIFDTGYALQKKGIELEEEGDAEGFLTRSPSIGQIVMT